MNMLRFQLSAGFKLSWLLLRLVIALGISAVMIQRAEAGFIGDYTLSNWTLTSTDPLGTAFTPDLGLTLVIRGANDGTGNPGGVDFTILAPAAGMVQFTYTYTTDDPDVGFDFAGYLLGVNFVELANTTGQTGTVQFPVMAGQLFGFRVGTQDNLGEHGLLTISDFTAPSASAVPEPASVCLVGLGVLGALGAARAHRRSRDATRTEERT
jgi:hypothetical protein